MAFCVGGMFAGVSGNQISGSIPAHTARLSAGSVSFARIRNPSSSVLYLCLGILNGVHDSTWSRGQ